MKAESIILGAGFTGLGAGITSRFPILEAESAPGGICASYSVDGFRFERGGGHWIFGGRPALHTLFQSLAPCRRYQRKSAVLFLGNLPATQALRHRFVDYPLQYNLAQLGDALATTALKEMNELRMKPGNEAYRTMDDWLHGTFGEQLCEAFFTPFHEQYTAGLFRTIAPQDVHKTPIDWERVRKGAEGSFDYSGGYNPSYLYPISGLDSVAAALAKDLPIQYGTQVTSIDLENRALFCADGRSIEYERLMTTAPLNRTCAMAGLSVESDPFTSVLVVNLGVELGSSPEARHGNHWLYIPDSQVGYHRIGYYSNVDAHFLPASLQDASRYGSLYIEFAFPGGKRPSSEEASELTTRTIAELTEHGLITRALVSDVNWVEVGYTWRRPESHWKARAIEKLRESDVYSIGRYGNWLFQGILESLEEGMLWGAAIAQTKSSS